jgi:hypothetical protein
MSRLWLSTKRGLVGVASTEVPPPRPVIPNIGKKRAGVVRKGAKR